MLNSHSALCNIVELSDIPAIQPTPVEISPSPAVNDPFSLSCFSDIDNQHIPSDADEYVNIKYRWEIQTLARTYQLPEDAVDPSRIQINPKTGNNTNCYCQIKFDQSIKSTYLIMDVYIFIYYTL